MKASSFEQLEYYISEDQKRKDSRIVRFVNVETLDLWCKVKNLLTSKCENIFFLSHYCQDDDLTPNMIRLLRSLKDVDRNSLLVPLSEHLRITNDDIFSQIVNLQFKKINESNSRLYIPMYRMGQRLKDLIDADSRLDTHIYFLETGKTDDDYALFILPENLSISIKGNKLHGYKKYLEYWESNPNKPIILHTKNAAYYKDYAFADNVKVLTSAFEILKYLGIITEPISQSWGEKRFWQELLSKAEVGKPIANILASCLGLKEFDVKQILLEWTKQDEFGKWLIWLWFKLEAKTPYIQKAINDCDKHHELVASFVNTIFDFDPFEKGYDEVYRERKLALKILNLPKLPAEFWDKYSQLGDVEKLYRLTDSTEQESEEIISLYGNISKEKKSKAFLKYAYPILFQYLEDYHFDDERITEYFAQYKIQKLSNEFDEGFINKVSEIASEKGIWWKWGVESRNKIIQEYYQSKTKIIWIDALGVEFLGLIKDLLIENYPGLHTVIKVGYASIPTITELNKEFIENREYSLCQDLDKLVHNGQYPNYISREINLVSELIKKAVAELDLFERVIVTSDHGASRGTVLAKGDSIKTSSVSDVQRNGRYCVDKVNKYESVHEACIDKDEYHVIANYDRFSIQGAAKNENHGGASLEEVLVPVVILSREPLEEKIGIDLLTKEAKVQSGKVIIKFKLNKNVSPVYALIDRKKYDCHKQDDYWYFEPECDQRTEYTAQIASKHKIGQIIFKVIKGIVENKKFDI